MAHITKGHLLIFIALLTLLGPANYDGYILLNSFPKIEIKLRKICLGEKYESEVKKGNITL
jgi:hypothetical protein